MVPHKTDTGGANLLIEHPPENILFNLPYVEERYQKTLEVKTEVDSLDDLEC